MSWLLSFGALVAIAVVIEAFRATTRRRFVREWAQRRSLELVECRYVFLPFSPNWLVHYRVVLRDERGKLTNGVAAATGFLRSEAWVDFEGSGRGQR